MGYVGKIQDTAGNRHLVGSTLYGTCSTAAAETTKVVTCSDFSQLVTGVTIHVKFSNSNSSGAMDVKLNVNSTGAKSIVGMLGANAYGTGISWNAGSVVSFTYDGTFWVMNDSYWVPKTDTKVTQTATTTNSNYPILFKNSANQTDETDQVRYGNTSGKIPKINPSTGDINANSFNGLGIMAESAGGATTGFILSLGLSSIDVGADGITISANSGETQLEVPDGSTYTLGAACEKGVDSSVPSTPSQASSSNVPTTAAVSQAIADAVGSATGGLVYKGTVSAENSLLNVALEKGWYYIVTMPTTTPATTSITIGGKTCEAGDMVLIRDSGTYTTSSALGNEIDVLQSNIDTLTTTEVSNLWTAAVAVS